MTTALLGALIVLGSVTFATAGLVLTRRGLSHRLATVDNDFTGLFVNLVGVMYAVLVAFIVVIVWEQYTDAEAASNNEVTRVSNLLRNAEVFPRADRIAIRRTIIRYTELTIDPEWESLGDGRTHPRAQAAYARIWDAYYHYSPRTNQQQAYYDQSLERLNELGELRRLRLVASQAKVPGLMWILLIAGGILMVASTWIFSVKSLRLHSFGVAVFAGVTGFVLFLIFALEHPFSGDIGVKPAAFESVTDRWSDARIARGIDGPPTRPDSP